MSNGGAEEGVQERLNRLTNEGSTRDLEALTRRWRIEDARDGTEGFPRVYRGFASLLG
jgi:hypothetical protein